MLRRRRLWFATIARHILETSEARRTEASGGRSYLRHLSKGPLKAERGILHVLIEFHAIVRRRDQENILALSNYPNMLLPSVPIRKILNKNNQIEYRSPLLGIRAKIQIFYHNNCLAMMKWAALAACSPGESSIHTHSIIHSKASKLQIDGQTQCAIARICAMVLPEGFGSIKPLPRYPVFFFLDDIWWNIVN
jgi:hypothetical protein